MSIKQIAKDFKIPFCKCVGIGKYIEKRIDEAHTKVLLEWVDNIDRYIKEIEQEKKYKKI